MISQKVSQRLGYFFLVSGILVYIAFIVQFNFTQDDAFITFRYAANYLNGDGLVFNIGERVEGYTNFLWLILLILGKLIGFDYIIFSKILGTICGAGTISISYLLAEDIFGTDSYLSGLSCLILGAVYSLAYWAVSGLEIAAFSLCIVASLYFYLRRSLLTAVSLILATLFRPEGGLAFVIILLYDMIKFRRFSKYIFTVITIYSSAIMPFLVFKWYYFGYLLPNPFYAKTNFDFNQLANGLEYTGQFFWHYLGAGLFLVPLILVLKKWTSSIRLIVLFITIYIIYIIVIGGDVLKVHRFFVPLMALIIPVTIYGFATLFKKRLFVLSGIVLLLCWQLYFPRQHIMSFHHAEKMLNKNMGEMIDNLLAVDHSDFTLAVSTIGIVGYKLIGHQVIDLLGLTDSTIARHPETPIEGLSTTWKETKYNSKYVLTRQPDYILFSTALKPSAPAERALFLYPQFLSAYRTIGFLYGGVINDIYKRFLPITEEPERTVDPKMVQLYNDGLNQMRAGQLEKSSASFKKAWSLCPEPKYPYLLYQIAKLEMMQKNYAVYNGILDELVKRDTMMYVVYKDLFIIESNIKNNTEKAAEYHAKLLKLVPWYVPRLDSFIVESQKRIKR